MLFTKPIQFYYKNVVKPILFRQEPELVHDNFLTIGNFLGRVAPAKLLTKIFFNYKNPKLNQTILGLNFINPVGLSAGFDKDANLMDILGEVGFGFMQIGTVTLNPYEGNPSPRAYRLPKSRALVVYYGLKNIGIEKIIPRVQKSKSKIIKSISIGKTNCAETATCESGVEDYFSCLREVIEAGVGDFYTINISCPNTFGGEPFTTPDTLEVLLKKLYTLKINKPVFLKMPINLPWGEFKQLLDVALKYDVDGVIIGNLNKDRSDPAILDEIPEHIKGSISGVPTQKLSNELIKQTYAYCGNKLVIIGVGGIFSAEDAYEKIKFGASLVQLITGMIYEGPQLIGQINKGLVKLLQKDGYTNINDAVGVWHKSYFE